MKHRRIGEVEQVKRRQPIEDATLRRCYPVEEVRQVKGFIAVYRMTFPE